MKPHLILAFAIAHLSLTQAFSQALAQPPMISVSGSAEVKVAPDEIFLRVGVETRHESLEDAKKQNDERVSKALAFLKASDVKGKDVQTDFISIEPTYDSNVSRTKPVTYVVRKSIEVKLNKIESFEGLLTGLLTNGVNNVHGIEFRTSQLRKHRDAARAIAIRAAKEKADALASELGVKRGKVYSINANDWGGSWNSSGSYWGGRYGGGMAQNAIQNIGGPSEAVDDTLSIGQISVSASVNVSFLIE
ncbi:MAG: SIMPL domain-containing protein [Verrucomicrobia subdivision 3 bacterium]|nr:SIMPL domain-containing protein [Limisphaerales bacterium]